jgi:hypothetical protein
MYELHKHEQYFFDEATLDHLSTFLRRWQAPCCLCAPLLGRRLAELGSTVTVLDIDERFAQVPGFRRYDVYRPVWLGREFDIILCDPPFFTVSLAQLFSAIRLLSRNDFRQPLLVSYLQRRAQALLGTFAPFDLRPTGYLPSYQTIKKVEHNEIEFYGNIGEAEVRRLRAA